MIDRETILKFLGSSKYQPLRRSDLADRFGLSERERVSFRRLLAQMLKEGTVVRVKSNRFALPSDVDLVIGTLQAHEKGFGFVVQEKEGAPDVFIAPGNMHTALHGDVVAVRLYPPRRDRRDEKRPSLEGKIIRVQERKTGEIVGTLARTQQFLYVIPDNPRITRDIYLNEKHSLGAKPGDKVVAQITQWESVHSNPEGKIIEVLGGANTPGIDILAIIRKFNLPHRFPKTVETDVAHLPDEVQEKDLEGRRDFRNDVVVTIDPDDAKDFDDAISLTRLANGRWRLGVHIADVAHYIRLGSPLDKEAFERGTSVYFPGRVVPMLPEKLSNNLCSLKQDVNRLVKSVVAELAADGSILKQEFFNGIIRSKKRYTYKEVKKIVGGEDPQLAHANEETVPTLKLMKELALILQKRRLDRGSLDLDLPSVKIWVDGKGKVTAIEKEERDIAHTMIEEFMLVANELVARHLADRGLACMFRVHEPPSPESLDDWIALVKGFGFKIPPVTSTKKIQQFLASIKGHPDSYAINYNLLRALKQAVYSTKNIGHYALASAHYCHFTSPIRRYPDLMVHRLLQQTLDHKHKVDVPRERMAAMAKHCSERERLAAEAEYDAVDLKKLEYLQEQIAQKKHLKMEGVVRTIMNFGFFVQTNDFLIDGLVHASTLTDDFYNADGKKHKFEGKRTGKYFKLGDPVTVEPIKIDLVKRQVDFRVVSTPKSSTKKTPG